MTAVVTLRKVIGRIGALIGFMINEFALFFRRRVKEHHQLTSTTALNRYPELFNEARNATFKDQLAILSFGCSTGEECSTMTSYYPGARIIGVDINRRNLKKAISHNNNENVKFMFSSNANITEHGKYDIIFCLSVLCRWEDTKDVMTCEKIYPFHKFEETVEFLSDQIATGGLFVIYNSNFKFEDTKAFSNFEIVATPSVTNSGFVHKFDANNRRVHETHRHCIYRKIT
jgi:hypothetical protein